MKKVLICLGLFLVNISQILLAQGKVDPVWGGLRDYNKVLVHKVIRADTFILESGEEIRLIGLHTPGLPRRKQVPQNEFGAPDSPRRKQMLSNEFRIPLDQPEDPTVSVEENALGFAKNLMEGRYIRLEFDVQKKDEDFYTLAYAFLPDGIFVNAEIVRQGFANLKIQPPNTKYLSQLKEAYQEARREKRGLQGE